MIRKSLSYQTAASHQVVKLHDSSHCRKSKYTLNSIEEVRSVFNFLGFSSAYPYTQGLLPSTILYQNIIWRKVMNTCSSHFGTKHLYVHIWICTCNIQNSCVHTCENIIPHPVYIYMYEFLNILYTLNCIDNIYNTYTYIIYTHRYACPHIDIHI